MCCIAVGRGLAPAFSVGPDALIGRIAAAVWEDERIKTRPGTIPGALNVIA